nr:uncharacterized protein LOC105843864 isoform X2 [Hydra vulgaris]
MFYYQDINMKATYKKNCFRSLLLITSLTNVMMQYSYPARKSSKYSFTVYKDRKIDDSSNTIETHADFKECITSCYNKKENCKSIDVKIEDNITLICRFFKNDFPKTKEAEGFLFILAKPPNCSLSCSLATNTCGKCDCNPSCAARNRRQHLCNCTNATNPICNTLQSNLQLGFNNLVSYCVVTCAKYPQINTLFFLYY